MKDADKRRREQDDDDLRDEGEGDFLDLRQGLEEGNAGCRRA